MKYALDIFLFILIIMPGCLLKQNHKKVKISKANTSEKFNYQEIIALHSEIPDAPLGFDIEKITCDVHNSQIIEIIYKPKRATIVDRSEIQKMYLADMEMLGWQNIGHFVSDTQIQYVFDRPKHKILCSIYIQIDGTIRLTLLQK